MSLKFNKIIGNITNTQLFINKQCSIIYQFIYQCTCRLTLVITHKASMCNRRVPGNSLHGHMFSLVYTSKSGIGRSCGRYKFNIKKLPNFSKVVVHLTLRPLRRERSGFLHILPYTLNCLFASYFYLSVV